MLLIIFHQEFKQPKGKKVGEGVRKNISKNSEGLKEESGIREEGRKGIFHGKNSFYAIQIFPIEL